MKRLLLSIFLLLALLCVGCHGASTPTDAPEESLGLPQDLIGTWVSADPGELDMVETITFEDDGTMTVSCTYQGKDAGTIRGTCVLSEGRLLCSITEGSSPYSVTYSFQVDGRELLLTDAEHTAQYLRAS